MKKHTDFETMEEKVNKAASKISKKQVIFIKEKQLVKDLRHLVKEIKEYAR